MTVLKVRAEAVADSAREARVIREETIETLGLVAHGNLVERFPLTRGARALAEVLAERLSR